MRAGRGRLGSLFRGGAVAGLAAAVVTLGSASPVGAAFDPGERTTISGVTGMPIPGDFDADGYADVLFYNPGATADPFLKGGPSGFQRSNSRYSIIGSGYRPISGDFDGNGVNDILWYRPGAPSDFYWYFEPGGTYTSVQTNIVGTYQVVVADFDANGIDDIFWYAPGSRPDYIWYSNGDGTHQSVQRTVSGRYVALGGDFDGNGYADIIWYGPGNAPDYQWNFNPDGTYVSIKRTITGVYQPFAGDFDGNGVDDVFWYRPGANGDYVWYYSPSGYVSQRASQSGHFVGIPGNYDDDPADEIFWAGVGASELWTEPPSEYWWSDTFLDDLTIAPEGPRTGYSRSLFEHWIIRAVKPAGKCDTREVVLSWESRVSARVNLDTCAVDQGRWLSYYDNQTLTAASQLHIDHMVPLAEAWDSGAAGWSAARRRDFANDLGVPYALVAVSASSNTSKGDRDPAEWMPPYAAARCRYASEWVATKVRWGLTADQAEVDALDAMLRTCGTDRPALPADPRIAPRYFDPTPPPPPPPPTTSCSSKGNAYVPANGGCIDRYDANHNGDINCGELPAAARPVRVKVIGVDPYGLDADRDGWGCE